MSSKIESVVPRESVATPEDVKRFLHLTPEAADELQRDQKLALYNSRALLSEDERRVGRGIELERHYRTIGDANGLAEALKLQGRYLEAAEAATNEDLKIELIELAQAVDKEDVNCGCDDFKEQGGYNLPQQNVEMRGHSLKHNGEVPFIRCQNCGELNARPSPTHLTEQRAVRNSDLSDKEKLNYFKI